ncbi:Uncharacterised protein [Bordetella pertussis]|nr:Uncharacterised protein [Bordetella pertussis]
MAPSNTSEKAQAIRALSTSPAAISSRPAPRMTRGICSSPTASIASRQLSNDSQ